MFVSGNEPSKSYNLTPKEIDAALLGPSAVEWIKNVKKSSLNNVIERCITQKKYHLLKPVLCRVNPGCLDMPIDKPVFHFLLDKVIKEDINYLYTFTGGLPGASAFTLANALEECLATLQKNDDILVKTHSELSSVIDRILKALSMCIYFDTGSFTKEKESLLIDYILDENRDFPLLIPVSFPAHSVELMIERTGKDQCTVTLFNSGTGRHGIHHKWPGTNLHQLSLSYENVPLQDLTANGIWEPLLKGASYDNIFALVKKGTLRPPSKQRFDYQIGQMQGTCPSQAIMAFFRYYLLKEIEGSAQEKLGVYHLLKTFTRSIICSQNFKNLHSSIKSDTEDKMERFAIEQDLYKVAQDDQSYADMVLVIESFLREIGETSFLERAQKHMNHGNSPIEKFLHLLTFQRRIAHHFLENYNEMDVYDEFTNRNSENKNIYSLSQQIINEKNTQYNRISNIWDLYFMSGKLNEVEKLVFKRGLYSAMDKGIAQEWLSEKKDKELTDPQKEMLERLQNNLNTLETTKGLRGDPFLTIDEI